MDKIVTIEELRAVISTLRRDSCFSNDSSFLSTVDVYNEAIADVLSLLTNLSTLKLDDDGYLWKWIERALFDKTNPMRDSLSVIAHYPSAPWEKGRWDVDHKPYAAEFYKTFPKARG